MNIGESSDFHQILYAAADFELDECHVINNEKVAMDRFQVRQNVFIVVLKITLLHRVSVITNFVIPKRNKKKQTKNITHFRLQPARPTISTILGMVIEEVRAIFAPSNFLILSVTSQLGAIENLWKNALLR